MRSILLAFLMLSINWSFAQITIDNTTYSPTQLVDGVLIPVGSGTTISNVQFSGVYNSSNRYQVGHFSTAGTTLAGMGITSGLVLSTGNTANIPLALGTNPGSAAQMSTGYTSCTAGEIREGGTCGTFVNDVNVLAGSNNYYNAAILEFDFVPVSSNVEFKYMFGSEEYEDDGGWINYQCSSYNDKFGFLISGPGIAGVAGYDNNAVNIATLANGSEVGINSVNNGIVGSSGGAPSASNCSGVNPAWVQNASTAEFLGTIDGTQLNGNTIVLTASRSGLTPGQTYHIRLIVTDVNDAAYDAVVYLEAGSFTTQSPCTPPANPTASVTVQPDCTTPTGTILVTAPTGPTIEYSVDGVTYQPGGTFAGLVPGSYDVFAQDMSTGCVSDTTIVVVNPLPQSPANPTASVTIQPDCTTPTGTIIVTAPLGATLEYSVDGVTYQSGTTFSGLAPGNYDVTVQNTSTGCTSGTTSLTVNAVPTAPANPTASVTIQPDCTTLTGTIVVTAPIGATLEYSVDGVTYQSGTTFSGLAPGNYDVTVQNTSTGCTSGTTSLTVNAVPAAPANPTASVTIQPDCTTPTGTIVVTAPTGATLEYSVDGVTYQSGTTFTGLAPGNYGVTVQNTSTGCTSGTTSLTVNAVPGAPANPTASVTIQPDCTTPTGTIVVTTPTGATLEYSLDGVTYQPGTSFSGLAPGNYDVTVQNTSTGCTSGTTSLTVNAVPNGPATPTASVTIQPDCTAPTGTIVVTAPIGVTLEYSIDAITYQSSTSFSGLAPGNYDLTVLDSGTGCTSASVSLTVNPVPADPVAPTFQFITEIDCDNSTASIEILGPIGNNYQFYLDGAIAAPIGQYTVDNLQPSTSYVLTVTDTITGCTSGTTGINVGVMPSDSDCNPVSCGDLFVPTAFSPNGDNNNESFGIKINADCVEEMNLRVFDRWGERVFETTDPETKWDGSYRGEPLSAGVFVYTLEIKLNFETEMQSLSGNVTLFK
ncbi:MAG: choice-of-anchor L domain-containing protein [Crocinitomicaceae bacterium]|nr:choice-of-anchor L domain-containing protein [Crocinitomicaceae bacterium]